MRCFNDLTAPYPKISDAPQAVEIRWGQRNLEKIRNISSLAIENANPWRQLKTTRLELYLYGIISFIFDVEHLYNFSPVNRGNGARRRSFFGAMQKHREQHSSSLQSGVLTTWLLSIRRYLTLHESIRKFRIIRCCVYRWSCCFLPGNIAS